MKGTCVMVLVPAVLWRRSHKGNDLSLLFPARLCMECSYEAWC